MSVAGPPLPHSKARDWTVNGRVHDQTSLQEAIGQGQVVQAV